MALQARDALGISIAKDLSRIEGTILFYDSFYRAQTKKRTGKELGHDGKLRIYPACGLEFAGGATDRARLCKQDYSWMATLANMAVLAWPEEAKKRAIYKMANTTAPQARFPAFFGPGHDWHRQLRELPGVSCPCRPDVPAHRPRLP